MRHQTCHIFCNTNKWVALFDTDPETHLSWFRPASFEPLYRYELVGLLFGLALYNGITLPVSLPLAFYRKLLGHRCGLKDLTEGWPSLATGFRELLQYQGDVEHDLARDYVFSFSANGLHLDVDMADPFERSSGSACPGKMKIMQMSTDRHHETTNKQTPSINMADRQDENLETLSFQQNSSKASKFEWPGWDVEMAGSDDILRPVTEKNRQAYVRSYAEWMMDWSIRPQFYAFAKGFFEVIDMKTLRVSLIEN